MGYTEIYYPLVMTNSSPWDFDGPNRNRWFDLAIKWWIFPWRTVKEPDGIFWVNYSDLTPTSLESWLVTRGIIPMVGPRFQVSKLL